jgi:hypothetical protein
MLEKAKEIPEQVIREFNDAYISLGVRPIIVSNSDFAYMID